MATRKKAAKKKRAAKKRATQVPLPNALKRSGGDPAPAKRRRGDGSKSKIVRLMRKFERDAKEKEDFRMSVSDYLRLLQMKRELDDQPGNVEVRWVETPDEDQSDGK